MTLKAPQYQARNTATDDLLVSNGRPIVGSRSFVAAHVEAMVSEANRSAFVIEPVDLMAALKRSLDAVPKAA